ncbi:unnamed protein product [Rotaria sp. Silwood2]|nr:unnamed protein product [Rotaria sp. Silwood2]CAF2920199.1 unnamed protein product [Rotaria sp. Silwood2]CAF3334036.1 unnamed protein product [Rotaria sp. Silwood2]CAF3993740.1 unnamed protein product [Rotaria sp. Silwood2]CAF4237158.1 unnamed protein product [Rotaria sp. Silwood2]
MATCGPQQTIINEGKKLCCYYDTKNIPTIGVGFNLQRTDAATVMAKYHLTLANVLKDCSQSTSNSCLKSEDADGIFNTISYPEAAACVDRYVPNLPTIKRAGIIDVAFAGCATLNKFVNMKNALERKDWKKAAEELRNSAWCQQVKATRCDSDYNCIIDESCSGQSCGHFTTTCSSNSECSCFRTSNGTGFCALSDSCSKFTDCTSCLSSTSVCIIDSCCQRPICYPLSLGESCTSSPSGRNFQSHAQLNLKPSHETMSGM